ncbi:NAD(P)H-binding protein [Aestuariibacter salexigens]|uniref:NAD(P)H-binding protein n=1 Tax=Aestuariibacter salexigens TaxID=226010 RepID=UPI000414A694|nr:NAD(P)H-binding protein [Aestuariibacter salexigens]
MVEVYNAGQDKTYTAVVLGATGLVGSALVQQLLLDSRYTQVTCLLRKPVKHSQWHDPMKKLHPLVIDFEQLQDYQGYFGVNHVYVCLGTTMKKAGSKSAFRRVDFEFVHIAAQLARGQRAESFVWISSVGADAKSSNFYLRVKGELENAILSMPGLRNPSAVRPSLLLGERNDSRPAELFGIHFSRLLAPLMFGPLAKYKPVSAATVAANMIRLQVF